MNAPGSGRCPEIRIGRVEDHVGPLAVAYDLGPVLLVTDQGVREAGHADRVAAALGEAGIEVTIFDEVQENPTERDVVACRDAARQAGAVGLVAVGGGSCIDAAKGAGFVLGNGGKVSDYRGWARAEQPLPPLLAIPTTAGTGSETQSFAILSDSKTHEKMACGAPTALPVAVVLDASLTVSMPAAVTARTGLDALVHAIETRVTRARGDASVALSEQAFRMLVRAFPTVLREPNDRDAREAMLVGAATAGRAIELSMLGAAHACANPLTARFGVPHGVAVGQMCSHVIRFNAADSDVADGYASLAGAAGLAADALALADHVEALVKHTGLASLASWGIGPEHIDALGAAAVEQWTGRFNPVPVDGRAFSQLYARAIGLR